MAAQIRAFRKVLAQQTIRVLVGATLPWALRIAEVDRQAGVDAQLGMLGHFRSLIPCERLTQLLRKLCHPANNRFADCFRALSRERGSVLHSWTLLLPFPDRKRLGSGT